MAALDGRTVVVTRATEQASSLSARLRALGATVVELPATVVVDAADGMAELTALLARPARFEWIVVTSRNGASCVARALGGGAVRPARLAAVGPGTADALAAAGLPCDLVPATSLAASLVVAFDPPRRAGAEVLVVQAPAARPVVVDGLRARGWTVAPVAAYETRPRPAEPERAGALRTADAVVFAAGSAVRAVLAAYGAAGLPPVVVCMGPITAAAAAEGGVDVSAVADPHTLDGLVAAIVSALA